MSIEYYLQIKLKDYILKLEIVRIYLNNALFWYFDGYKIAIDHISFKCIGLRQYVIFNYPYVYTRIFATSQKEIGILQIILPPTLSFKFYS